MRYTGRTSVIKPCGCLIIIWKDYKKYLCLFEDGRSFEYFDFEVENVLSSEGDWEVIP